MGSPREGGSCSKATALEAKQAESTQVGKRFLGIAVTPEKKRSAATTWLGSCRRALFKRHCNLLPRLFAPNEQLDVLSQLEFFGPAQFAFHKKPAEQLRGFLNHSGRARGHSSRSNCSGGFQIFTGNSGYRQV